MTIHIPLTIIWYILGGAGLLGLGIIIGIAIMATGIGDSIGRGLNW